MLDDKREPDRDHPDLTIEPQVFRGVELEPDQPGEVIESGELSEDAIEHESPTRVVWTLAWPAVALNSLQVVNTLLDRAFIGHLPQAALTAHGGSMNVLFLMFSLAMALGTAATALVSRAYGAGNVQEFVESNRRTVSLSILVGFGFYALTLFVAPFMARLLLPANDVAAISLMIRFLGEYAWGLPAIYLIQTLAGSLRGIGDTRSPMVISGLQILLHIALNYMFIFPPTDLGSVTIPGLDLGLIGAGRALSTSAWISAVVYVLYSVRTPLGATWKLAFPNLYWARRILRVAIPAAAMSVLRVTSFAAFTLILKFVPSASVAIAAMSIGFSVEGVMFMPAFGLSMAAAALVGQSLGMKKPDRAERLAWTAGHHAAIVTALLLVPLFVFAPNIALTLVDGKQDIAHQATLLIRYLCVTEIFFAYSMVLTGAMQGAGDTVRPLWISVIGGWFLRVPIAWALALPLGVGSVGAWIAIAFTQMLQGIMTIWVFRQGGWKAKEV